MLKISLAAMLGIAIASPAMAGSAGRGLVTNLVVSNVNVITFLVSPRASPPSCQSSTDPNRFAISTTTDTGKAMIALVYSAQARGKQIFVGGTGDCSTWAGMEGVGYLVIED